MLKALYTAASGMRSQQFQVDVLANNLANVNTTGYKRTDATFADLLYVTSQTPGATTRQGSTLPGLQVGGGSTVVGTAKNFRAGDPFQTNNPLDLLVQGDGFFQLQAPDGSPVFTRSGNFLLDRDGNLVNPAGLKLQNGPTGLSGATEITISVDGKVTAKVNGNVTEVGQFQLTRFPNPAGLSAEGGNIYKETPASGSAITGNPGDAGFGTLQQGYLERSNVDIATELINLILAQRAYETNSRAISTADEMLSTANQITR